MKFTFEPLVHVELYGRNSSIASHIFNVVRNAIITLKLLPGDSLSEAETAKQLGVSRQPVREAFIQLSRIGMLNILPQKGSFVVKISERDVENARFIREAIEAAVVLRACTQATPVIIEQFMEIISAQEQAAGMNDHLKFLELDDSFHYTIALSADCLYSWHIIENMKAQMDRVRFLSLPEATPITKIVDQHRRIANAIKNGEQDAAQTAIKMHLSELIVSLPILAERHKHLFTKDSCLHL